MSQSNTHDPNDATETATRRQVALELQDLEKRYGDLRAVAGINLKTKPGEFITLLGPSGSGKTTTLNLIAGFLTPDTGEVLIDGNPMSTVPPHRRNIGLVFQNYLLFPHMTAYANVAFPLKRRKLPKDEVERSVLDVLAMVGLEGLGNRYPRELSGGQQQRVALARALVYRPPLLLMDEPLGALDKKLREVLQLEIKRIHREVGTTFVYVTHDQEEALVLSDRIAVFNAGAIEQVGAPQEIYDRPSSSFVAEFVGDSNLFRGSVETDGSSKVMLTAGQRLQMPSTASWDDSVALLVRPENMRIGQSAHESNKLTGRVAERVYLGSGLKTVVEVAGIGEVTIHEPAGEHHQRNVGEDVVVSWAVEDGVAVEDSGTAASVLPGGA